MITGERLQSPRLAALQEQLAAGDRAASGDFWREIAVTGAPLIEPVADDDRDVLVTFLWRDQGETANMDVIAGVVKDGGHEWLCWRGSLTAGLLELCQCRT